MTLTDQNKLHKKKYKNSETMKKTLTFEKWDNGKWFVIYPDYEGLQEDLEMVDGADTLLEYLTTDGMYVSLMADTESHSNWACLQLTEHDELGGTYEVLGVDGFDESVWLCNVVHAVFGEHPEAIFFKVID